MESGVATRRLIVEVCRLLCPGVTTDPTLTQGRPLLSRRHAGWCGSITRPAVWSLAPSQAAVSVADPGQAATLHTNTTLRTVHTLIHQPMTKLNKIFTFISGSLQTKNPNVRYRQHVYITAAKIRADVSVSEQLREKSQMQSRHLIRSAG